MGYEISTKASATIVLHAAKHGGRAVSGVLLGTTGGGGVKVTGALPLFHSTSGAAAPLMETALTQVWPMIQP